jgi:hypothetical protein
MSGSACTNCCFLEHFKGEEVRILRLLLLIAIVSATSTWTVIKVRDASRPMLKTYTVVAWNRNGQLALSIQGYEIRIQNGCAIVDKPKYQAVCEVFAVQENP